MSSEDDETIMQFFRDYDNLLIHDVTRYVAEKARQLSRQFSLRPNDAIHLATALLSNADVFESWNTRDFSSLQGEAPIQIRLPTWEGSLRMKLDT